MVYRGAAMKRPKQPKDRIMSIEITKQITEEAMGEGWNAPNYEVAVKFAAFATTRIPEIIEGAETAITATKCSGHLPMTVTEDGEEADNITAYRVQAAFDTVWEEFCNLSDYSGNIA